MEFFSNRKIKQESDILDALKKLKQEETQMWEWIHQGDEKRRLVVDSGQNFREILLDIIRFLDLSEREIKKNSNLFGGIREEAKDFIGKIKEIHKLVKIQIKRFREEIKEENGIPSVETLKSILDHGKEHNAEFSRLSSLLEEAIKLGENLGKPQKNWFEMTKENIDYKEGVHKYVNDKGIAQFGLVKDIINARIENEELYNYWFWTSASLVYSVEKKKVKLVLSKDKKINKLLDYDLIKNEDTFLPTHKNCSYDLVQVNNQEVYEFDWDKNVHDKIKEVLISGVRDFDKYKFKQFSISIFQTFDITTSQWRPLVVDNSNKYSDVFAYDYLNVNGRFLLL